MRTREFWRKWWWYYAFVTLPLLATGIFNIGIVYHWWL